MSFTNQQPRVATAEDCQRPWGGHPRNFRCGFCGHKIVEGELFRWLFTNDIPEAPGNPLVCDKCITDASAGCDSVDAVTEQLRAWWASKWEEYRQFRDSGRWWWFLRQLRAKCEQDR